MKSRTKRALRVVPAVPVLLSLSIEGVLRDVRHAFHGLCVAAGKQVLAAMMEADRQAVCGQHERIELRRQRQRGEQVLPLHGQLSSYAKRHGR